MNSFNKEIKKNSKKMHGDH